MGDKLDGGLEELLCNVVEDTICVRDSSEPLVCTRKDTFIFDGASISFVNSSSSAQLGTAASVVILSAFLDSPSSAVVTLTESLEIENPLVLA